MKTKKTRLKELRAELRHWQMICRLDVRSLQRTREKCKEIGAKMRQVQSEQDSNKKGI